MNEYPKNIGIIMDGNRRWALSRGLSQLHGHKHGAQTLKEVVKIISSLKVNELTTFAFSTENWRRSQIELDSIQNLIIWYLKSEIAELNNNNVQFKAIGEIYKFKPTLQKLIKQAEKTTMNNTGLKLNVALSYGGKIDLIEATKNISRKVYQNEISINEIDENIIKSNLLSNEVSNLDLLIRTGGEHRISNFLMWQLAYSEIHFTDKLWPELNEKEIMFAFERFKKTERRFGSSSRASTEKA